MGKRIIVFVSIFGFLCVMSFTLSAQTTSSKGLSSTEVQALINSAQDGDQIRLPAGNGYWNNTVTIPSDKLITILGADELGTKIYTTEPAFLIESYESKTADFPGSRISGIAFTFPETVQSGGIVTVHGQGWRVDHCTFTNTGTATVEGVQARGYSYEGHPVGVIDHNVFRECRVLVNGDLSLLANGIWSEPTGLGTNNAVFVEDNEFYRSRGDAIDSDYGGKYVFRNNYVVGCYVEAHSIQSGNRSARSWEIYNNTIVADGNEWLFPMFLRGGTGVIFGNRMEGFKKFDLRIDNMRSFDERLAFQSDGLADGTSPIDENSGIRGEGVASAWPVRDQIGRGTDLSPWQYNKAPKNRQMWFPAHAWDNDRFLLVVSPYMDGTNHIMGKNDLIDSGHLVIRFIYNRENELSNEGVDRKLQYDFANEPLLGYEPYTYPHPLVVGSAPDDPGSKPYGLKIYEEQSND